MTDERDRSEELDRLRRLLFGKLDAEDGWRRIDDALAAADDDARWARIESEVGNGEQDFRSALAEILRRRADAV